MPYKDGNPTLGEQIEEDARRRYYTDDVLAEARDLATVVKAVQDYAATAPLDLKSPGEIQSDLRAILGEPHVHRASIGNDRCALCRRDLRDAVHKRALP